jgi:hypothetical protein
VYSRKAACGHGGADKVAGRIASLGNDITLEMERQGAVKSLFSCQKENKETSRSLNVWPKKGT